MPLQNRVTPTGEILVDASRGTSMGNRGCLHDADRRLGTARWRSKAWICCTLDWKGVRRDPMPPGRWTALFFLDEATALAAGHRPCAYCRRAAFLDYARAWATAQGIDGRAHAPAIDARLHTERVDPATRRQRTWPASIGDLPDGVMIARDGAPGLLLGGRCLPWSFAGYGHGERVPPGTDVALLTPPSTVAAIREGYRPAVHPSAEEIGCAPGRVGWGR